MTTADWALVISLLSGVVALASFVWNVWSKFIFPKPRVETHALITNAFDSDGTIGPEAFTIRATNHGPSAVILHAAIALGPKKPGQRKNANVGFLYPYRNFPFDLTGGGPFVGGLPKKLEVGEMFTANFPVCRDWFEVDKLERFGFNDTFDRKHWCPKRDAAKVREDVLSGNHDGPPKPPAG